MAAKWDQLAETWDEPPFEGGPCRTYMIASTQRSGSYFLSHLLEATGRMGRPFEYLQPCFMAAFQKRFGQSDARATLREIFRRRTTPNGWFGMKAHWGQYDEARSDWQIDDLLRIDHFIFLERRDRVAQAVSLVIAEQTGSWTHLQRVEATPNYSATAITRALKKIEADYRGWRAHFAAKGICPIHIFYEDLVSDPLASINRIMTACGLEPLDRLPVMAPARQVSAPNRVWTERYIRERQARWRLSWWLPHLFRASKVFARNLLSRLTGGNVR